jgi:tetratricopeptide (TPR) repeat protein
VNCLTESVVESVEKINPNYADVDAWYNKGIALYGLGKYNEAIEYYDKSIEIDPNYALAWYNKGSALNKLGRHKEAKECHNKYKNLTQKPTYKRTLFRLLRK